jgi:hypothetical protein
MNIKRKDIVSLNMRKKILNKSRQIIFQTIAIIQIQFYICYILIKNNNSNC